MALSKAAAKKDSRACVLAFVGNYDYLGENKIKDDVVKNDYELIKKAVRSKFGDQNVKIVPPIYNLTVKDMSTFVSDWKKHLQNYIKNGDMVLVWVEGHGFTAGGASLLVPVDVDLEEHFGEWEQSSRLKHLINELQILNKEGVNHVVWNLCRESKIDDVPLMDNMAIKGSNFVILFGCQDNTFNSIGNNSVMKDGAAIRVSNVAYAYAQALEEELTLLETCRRTRNLVMKLTSNHQIPQTLETLTEPPKSFGFLGLLGQFMWNVVLKPAVKVVAHAGLDMVNWGAQQLVRAGHEAVDNFSFSAGGDSVGPFVLQQLFDMQRKTGLTCLEFVLPDINHVVDFKAPGDTHMPKGAAAWNIIHASTPAVLQIVDTFFSGPVSWVRSESKFERYGLDIRLWRKDPCRIPWAKPRWHLECSKHFAGEFQYLPRRHEGLPGLGPGAAASSLPSWWRSVLEHPHLQLDRTQSHGFRRFVGRWHWLPGSDCLEAWTSTRAAPTCLRAGSGFQLKGCRDKIQCIGWNLGVCRHSSCLNFLYRVLGSNALHQPVIGYDRTGILTDKRMSGKDALAKRFYPQLCMYAFTFIVRLRYTWWNGVVVVVGVATCCNGPVDWLKLFPLHCLVSATWLARGCKWGACREAWSTNREDCLVKALLQNSERYFRWRKVLIRSRSRRLSQSFRYFIFRLFQFSKWRTDHPSIHNQARSET